MHLSEVEKYRAQKEHLMRNEGTHPANKKSSFNDWETDNMPIYSDDGGDYRTPSIERPKHSDPSKVVQGI